MNRARLFVALCLLALPGVCPAIGRPVFVSGEPLAGSFAVVRDKEAARIFVDAADYPGVVRAARDLQADVARVSDVTPQIVQSQAEIGPAAILIGTIGRSPLIDRLVSDRKLDVSQVAGKWEATVTQVVADPLPGVEIALAIAGSDKRGTIYGVYELSEQIGVSPWHWWADVPPRKSDALFVKPGTHVQGPPKVKYRGIFTNDEEPCFGPWAREKFGGVNSKLYARVFELILRLRGNYLWPAMWGKAFNEDDPENPRLADEYGVVMGTSHHEPMLRAQQEWKKHGKGAWNYATNEAELKGFWRAGVERNRSYESVVTIGMRGDGDEPMVKGGDMRANAALLERIVADQRKLISETIDPDVTKVPQLWALYKEVADYYEHGLRVPDDVTLLWCDDNWGNIRRVPTPEERKRAGGAGVYYHFDFVGGPRSYKWINTNPLPKIWEQMNLAYRHGADRIWIVNVGDLKPMEVPTEFFLTMAWDPDALPKEKIADLTRQWATREFGPEHAAAIADVVSRYAKYNGWRKPELLEPTTFSLINDQEAERVEAAWDAIIAEAERIDAALPSRHRDAFYQLVLYPTKASGTVAKLYMAAGRNRLYAKQRRAGTNEQAARVRDLFHQDQNLSDHYHQLAGGKWNHMMDQTHIGYTSWNEPKSNVMPEVTEIELPDRAELGVATEGSESAWPGATAVAKLAPFDSINRQRRWVDVFNRGKQSFEYTATTDQRWIKLTEHAGTVDKDRRLWVSIDWDAAPVGETKGKVNVSGPDGATVSIGVEAVRSMHFTSENTHAVGGLTGPIVIDAESATSNVEAGGVRWEKIPDYGRGSSGMSIFPVTSPSVAPPDPQRSPRLEYSVLLPRPGEYHVSIVTSPSLNVLPGRGLRLAVSLDDQQPQVLDAFDEQTFAAPTAARDPSGPALRDWGRWVKDNVRTQTSAHKIDQPGVHTLKLWMVDPGVVVERLVIHQGDLPPTYLGPPPARRAEN